MDIIGVIAFIVERNGIKAACLFEHGAGRELRITVPIFDELKEK